MRLMYWILGGAALLLLTKKATPAITKFIRGEGIGDPTPYLSLITTAAKRHPELANRVNVLLGLLDQESDHFAPDVVNGRRRSPTGALGIGQFTKIAGDEVRRIMTMPAWRSRYDNAPAVGNMLKVFEKESHAWKPEFAIEAAALFLSFLINKWNGNVEAALTDYNAGGVAARIVSTAGTHAGAKQQLIALPDNQESQSATYSPSVLAKATVFREQGFGRVVRG